MNQRTHPSILIGIGLVYGLLFTVLAEAQTPPSVDEPTPQPEVIPSEPSEPEANEDAEKSPSSAEGTEGERSSDELTAPTEEKPAEDKSATDAVEPSASAVATQDQTTAPNSKMLSAPEDSSALEAPIQVEQDGEEEATGGTSEVGTRVSGVIVASGRATFYDKDEYFNEQYESDWPLDEQLTFQLEQTLLRLSGNLTESFSWEVMPCLTHMEDFSVATAYFNYEIHSVAQVRVGRFLLPFGQFNLRSVPGEYTTLSRPLIYQGHEDREFRFNKGIPSGFILTPRDDLGVMLWGRTPLGSEDLFELSYHAYLTNGLQQHSDTAQRYWADNNNGKQIGGRVGLGLNLRDVTVEVGGSLLSNVYEDDEFHNEGLNQLAWAADGTIRFAYLTDRWISLRGEFVDMLREVVPTVDLAEGDEGVQGFYAVVDIDLLTFLNIYYQFDRLTQRIPVPDWSGDEEDDAREITGFHDEKYRIDRHTVGLSIQPIDLFAVRIEYGRWLIKESYSYAHRGSIQTVLTF